MDRLGFGYDDVAALNPQIIYVSIAGFGHDGPSAKRRVYDNVIQAASGLASVQTDPVTGKPALFRHLICDKVTAYTAAQAVTAALFARERGASGQHITLSMLDAAVAFTWPDCAMDVALLDDDVTRLPTISANYVPVTFADGHAAVSVVTESEFRGYCAALGRPDLADDPRFSSPALRSENGEEYRRIFRGLAADMKLQTFLDGALKHDVPAGGMNDLHSVVDDPQILHNETFVVRDHPVAGTIREVRPAPRFSATPADLKHPAPTKGAHTDEVVSSLGLDVGSLRDKGAIA